MGGADLNTQNKIGNVELLPHQVEAIELTLTYPQLERVKRTQHLVLT